MATVTLPTTSIVKSGAGATAVKFGETVAQGQFVYVDASSQSKVKKAIATSKVTAAVLGMARNGGGNDQPGEVATRGLVENASGLTAGVVYVLSDSVAGGIMPTADLTSAPTGTWVTVIGVAEGTTSLRLGILAANAQAD